MSITFQQIRRQLYSDLPGSGFTFTAATVNAAGTSGITTIDPRLVEGGQLNYNANKYAGKYLLRPTLASADQIRACAALSISGTTATLKFDGANYSDTSTTANFEMSVLPLAEWLDVVNDALEWDKTEYEEVLAHGPTDYQLTTDASWTESNATDTVYTTASKTYSGIGGINLANSSANGYTRSGSERGGKRTVFGGIWKCNSGTGIVRLRDGSATSLASISSTYTQFMYGRYLYDTDLQSNTTTLDLEGTESTADIDFDSVFIVRPDDNILYLPSWCIQKPKAISYAEWTVPVDTNLWDAYGRRLYALVEDEDYRYFYRGGEANPTGIELLRPGLMDNGPLWITGDRAFSDFGTLTDDTSTTNDLLHAVVARSKWLLGLRYPHLFPELAGGSEPASEVMNQRWIHSTSKPESRRTTWGPSALG